MKTYSSKYFGMTVIFGDKRVQFKNGIFSTDDEDLIAKIESSSLFQNGEIQLNDGGATNQPKLRMKRGEISSHDRME